jgi:hypothetical protein
LNEAQRPSVTQDWFVGKYYFALFHTSKIDFLREVLFNPGEVLTFHVWEDVLKVLLVFFCEFEVLDHFFDGFESGENSILASKGVLSEEDFEGGLLFVFVLDEVGVGTGELVKVVVEKVHRSDWLVGNHLGSLE